MTLDEDLKFSWARPSAYVDDGVKPVFKVKTRLGREIKTTVTHPFLTVDGWRKLGELSVGDHIAVPRRTPVFGREPLGAHRMKLLAYMLGDGNMTGGVPRFTNANPAVREDFIEAAGEFGGLGVREETSGGTRTPTVCVYADRVVVRRHRQTFARTLRRAVLESRRPAREIAGTGYGQSRFLDPLVAGQNRPRHRHLPPVARGPGRRFCGVGHLGLGPGAQERTERTAAVVGRSLECGEARPKTSSCPTPSSGLPAKSWRCS